MSREIAVRRAMARKLKKSAWEPMRPVERGEKGILWPSWATRIYTNNRFTVMLDDNARTTAGVTTKAYISPHNAGRDIFWRDFQRIKNEIFGPEAIAVQYFPRESELVDVVNVYWLFVYPKGVLPEPRKDR